MFRKPEISGTIFRKISGTIFRNVPEISGTFWNSVTIRNSGTTFRKFPVFGKIVPEIVPEFRNLVHNGNGKNLPDHFRTKTVTWNSGGNPDKTFFIFRISLTRHVFHALLNPTGMFYINILDRSSI